MDQVLHACCPPYSQVDKEPQFLVRHSGTVTAERIEEELRAGSAKVEEDYLEMVSTMPRSLSFAFSPSRLCRGSHHLVMMRARQGSWCCIRGAMSEALA